MDNISLIIAIIICIILSAYFSATETAFSCANKIKLKNMVQNGNKKAKKVLNICNNYDKMLSTILIGNNIVNIGSASLSTLLFIDLLGNEKGPTISTIVLTIIVLIFGEISPKTIANQNPEKFAMFSAPILALLMKILTPINYLFSLWKNILAKIFKTPINTGVTEEELLTMVDEVANDGNIDKEEKDLIKNAIEFNDLIVGDIYTPRIDITAIEKNSKIEEIKNIFDSTAFSRIPIYDKDIDHIIGVLNQKDFYTKVINNSENFEKILKPVKLVTKNKKINELLKELQKEKMHIAIVINEFGETIGLVTLEDIVEEIVGDIWDEHDEVSIDIEKVSDEEYIVSGKANLEEVLSIFNKQKIEESQTVGGWIMETLSRLPKKDDEFIYENLKIKVISMNDKRVDKVKISFIEN